jgi:SAM-dependent methyltransferase
MSANERASRNIEARIYKDAVREPPSGTWRLLGSLLTERGLLARVVRKRLRLATPLDTEDRRVLEGIVMPSYRADPAIKSVLFVGCDTYTVHYQRVYFSGVDYWTLDPDPACARYGAEQHVIAPLEALSQNFPPDFFDLIICNGVVGWGLDAFDQCEAAFSQCYTCLADRGHLLIGWNDIPQRTPVSLAQIPALGRFRKHAFPPFGTWRYLTDTPYRHTYDFYRKPRRGNQ